MTPRFVRIYALGLLVIAALIVIHAPLSVIASVALPSVSLIMKAWKELFMCGLLPLAGILVHQTRTRIDWMHDRLLWLAALYAAIHLVSLLIWNGWLSALAGLAIDGRYVLYFSLVYVLLRAYPSYRTIFLRVFAVGAVVVVGFACVQLFLPKDSLRIIGYDETTIRPYMTIDENHDFIRYNSTLRGPNPLGAYAAMALVVLVSFVCTRLTRLRDWKWVAAIVASAVALYISYSRSAQLAAIAGVLVVVIVRYGRSVRLWYGLAVLGVIGVAGLAVINYVHPHFIDNVVLHVNPADSGNVNSNDGHWTSLVAGVQTVISSPFGDGIGSAGSASLLGATPVVVENQYLLVAHEAGWLGLVIYVALYAAVLWRLWQRKQSAWGLGVFAAGIAMGIVGLMLPVFADDTVAIVWWGLAAVLCAGEVRPSASFEK